MNKFLSISLIVLIMGVPLKDILIFTYYNLDKDFISSVLCINKDIPTSTCNGTCFLKKKMKESHDESENPSFVKEKNSINWLNIETGIFSIVDLTIAKRDFVAYKTMHSILFKTRIFQPPRQF